MLKISFVATKKVKGHTYYQLCQAYRGKGGKPTHRVLKHLGKTKPSEQELFLDEKRVMDIIMNRLEGLDKPTKAKILTIIGNTSDPMEVVRRLKAFASSGNQEFVDMGAFLQSTGY